MSDSSRIIIREANSGDKNFILSTWMKGNYFGNSIFKSIPQDLRFKDYTRYMEAVLSDPEAEARVACDESAPEWAVGFSITRQDTLYWIHIKEGYRRMGIGSLLLSGRRLVSIRMTAQIGPLSHPRRIHDS